MVQGLVRNVQSGSRESPGQQILVRLSGGRSAAVALVYVRASQLRWLCYVSARQCLLVLPVGLHGSSGPLLDVCCLCSIGVVLCMPFGSCCIILVFDWFMLVGFWSSGHGLGEMP